MQISSCFSKAASAAWIAWIACLASLLPLASASAATASPLVEACLSAAASKHKVAYELLRAIAEHESAFNHLGVGRNRDASSDYGLMQINSSWLPTLARFGITRQKLFDPCVNADVGAWILAGNFRTMGLTWDAVGAYNARTPAKRLVYANGVYRRLQTYVQIRVKRQAAALPPPAPAAETTALNDLLAKENQDDF